MSIRMKIGSVIACGMVMLICYVCYTGYARRAVYDIREYYPEYEGCSARMIEEMPEGYAVNYYSGNPEELFQMGVVEVTWQLSNGTNERMDVDVFYVYYDTMDGRDLYVMEKEESPVISVYENEAIIPAGKQVEYKEYLLVPRGCHEIMVESSCFSSQEDGGRDSFTLSF